MRLRESYQPFKHSTEELLNKQLLIRVIETAELSPKSLTEEVCFNPGAFHQDFLIVEDLGEEKILIVRGKKIQT